MDFTQDQVAIKRRRRLAEMLQGMAGQTPQGQMVGNQYVAPSITQNLAQLLAAYKSNKSSEQADTMEADLDKRKREALASVLSGQPGKSFGEKASYLNQVQDLDPELGTAIGSSLFKEDKPATGNYQLIQQQMPDGTLQPILLEKKTGTISDAGEAYKKPEKPKDTQVAETKMATIKAAKDQLEKVKSNFAQLKGTMSAGLGGQLLPTEQGKLFDASVDTMRGLVQGILKVPGLGSMSDFESKLDQAKIPSRGNYEAVTEQQINDLEQIINTMEQGYLKAVQTGGSPEASQSVAPNGIKFLGFENAGS